MHTPTYIYANQEPVCKRLIGCDFSRSHSFLFLSTDNLVQKKEMNKRYAYTTLGNETIKQEIFIS